MKFETLATIFIIKKGTKNNLIEVPNKESIRVLQIDDLRNDINLKYTNDVNGVFVTAEDLMIVWDGANAGTVGYGKSGYIGSTIAALKKRSEKKYDTKYLGLFLQTQFNYFQKNTTGATIPHINRKHLEDLKIPIPNYNEQVKIATVLGNSENLINKRKESIKLLDEFLKSVFFNMFGNTFKNEKGFKKVKIGEICDVTKLAGFEYSKYIKYQDSGDIIVVRGLNVKDGRIRLTNLKFIDQETSIFLKRSKLNKGDVVITYIGVNIGEVALIEENNKFHLAPNVAKITPKNLNELNSYYLLNYLMFNRGIFFKYTTNTAKQALNMANIREVEITLPDPSLQKKFAEISEKTEILKNKYKTSLTELENLFNSLAQKAFKGELDLTTMKKLENEVIQIQDQENNVNSILNPEMLAFIKKTNDLQNTFALLTKTPSLPDGLDKISKQIEQINKLIKPFEKIPKIPQEVANSIESYENIKSISSKLQENKKIKNDKIKWGDVSTEEIANWIKEEFTSYYFNRDMIFRLLLEKHVTFPLYYSSEELKTNPRLDEAEDLKSFIFSAINNENPFIKIEQVFYNGEKENFKLKITREDNKYYKELEVKEKSGIYFKIIE